MVLAHNIEWSNDYSILSKNTTGLKWFWFEVLIKDMSIEEGEDQRDKGTSNEYLMKS